MNFIKKNWKGVLLCLMIAIPSWILGKIFPIVGGPVFAILLGMVITLLVSDKSALQSGITFVSKKILQYAVILLGFGMNLSVILQTGKQSLPIILATITTSLVVAWVLHKILHVPGKISTLIGVGSSICGGSAIAATAPVIDADDEEVAQSISVIFFFNMLAALFFPMLGTVLGFSQTSGEAFGIFAGTAVNDTSSVTAAASTWDSMYNLGSATLDKAVTVKLTRTLAIIPITLVLAFLRTRREQTDHNKVDFKKIFPMFILYFIIASIITTIAVNFGVPAAVFNPAKNFEQVFHRSCHECNWSEYQYCEISENRSQAFASWIQLLDRYYLYEFADATRIRSVVKLRIFLIGGSGFRSFYFCILANRSAITIRKHPTNTKHHCIPIFVKNAEADSVRISTRFTPILSTDSVAARWLPHSASSTN